ncbi:homoserine dehydrogenase [Bacillus carboniphilus]|uniref:Homoserine dehydrogenase n=1 Tax=Bacillus carboniphilus TaxID=86663 RepID=A0ABN0VVN7_9BACI
MTIIHVAVLGYGTVGQGVVESIHSHQKELQRLLGAEIVVDAILVKDPLKVRDIPPGIVWTTNFDDILELGHIDVVLEAIVGCEPAFSYLKKAIQHGCHVVTANKVMFAHHGNELQQLADENEVHVGYEASVAGGIPIIRSLSELLRVNQVHRLEGILNGTSNYILTEMRENGHSFEEVLADAQKKGYAEADPTADVEGDDAFYKLMILSDLLYGEQPNWTEVQREGISKVDREQMELAEEFGYRFRHVASIEPSSRGLQGKVMPIVVPNQHPFYHVDGVDNAVNVEASLVGSLMFQGPGAGRLPTASAMVEDLVQVLRPSLQRKGSKTIQLDEVEGGATKLLKQWLLFVPQNPSLPTPFITSGKLIKHKSGQKWKAILFLGDDKTIYEWKTRLPMVRLYEIRGAKEWKELNSDQPKVPCLNSLAF